MTAAIRPNESDKQGFPATLIWAASSTEYCSTRSSNGIIS
jgi:hypothetical protein